MSKTGTVDILKALVGLEMLKKTISMFRPTMIDLKSITTSAALRLKDTFKSLRSLTNAFKSVPQTRPQTLRELLQSQGVAKSQYKKQAAVQGFKVGRGTSYLDQPSGQMVGAMPLDVPMSFKEKMTTFFKQAFDNSGVGQSIAAFKQSRGTASGSFMGPQMKGTTQFGKGLGVVGSALAPIAKVPWKYMQTSFKAIQGVSKGIWSSMSTAISGFGSMAMMGTVMVLFSLMEAMFPFTELITTLTEIFGVYGEIIAASFIPLIEQMYTVLLSETVLASIQTLANAFLSLFTALIPLIPMLVPLGAMLIEGLVAGIMMLLPYMHQLNQFFMAFLEVVMQILPFLFQLGAIFMDVLLQALPILSPLFDTLGVVLIALMPYITELAEAMGGALLTAFTILAPVLEWLLPIVATVFAALVTGLTTFYDAISGSKTFFEAVINSIKGIINAPIAAINALITGINSLIPGTDNDLSSIPYLAAGGITTGPTLAMIGDNPSGREAVIPLDSNNNPIGGMGGVTINVYGDLTESKKNEMVRELWIRGLV